jgi:hypothetical protein
LFSYTSGFIGDANERLLMKSRAMLPQNVQHTHTWEHLAKNPKISLNALSRSLKRDFLDEDMWPMAIAIENQRKDGVLNISLPSFVPISLYLSGGAIALNGASKIAEELVGGVDFKQTSYLVSGMRNAYRDSIVPTSIVIRGNVAAYTCSMLGSGLMVDGGLSFDLAPDAQPMALHVGALKLYDSHVKSREIMGSADGTITFFGDCSISCTKTSTLDGRIAISERYAYSISDPSSAPNDTVVVLNNINFQPAFIDYRFYPMQDKGYFKVDGVVDLSSTLVKVQSVDVESLQAHLGKRILFIESTLPIKGQPIIENNIEDFGGFPGSEDHGFSFEKQGNKAYLIVTKKSQHALSHKKPTP